MKANLEGGDLSSHFIKLHGQVGIVYCLDDKVMFLEILTSK